MERLQKVIAAAGITSRRKAEVLISEGRVAVNGETITELGYKVKRGDLIEVDGKAIEKEDKVYFLMNKPKRTMCTSDDEFGRQTVVDLVDCRQRIFTVGRLDYDTSGVIILTNDGDFAHEILSPKKHIPKTYLVRLDGPLTPKGIQRLEQGIELADGSLCQPAEVVLREDGTEPLCEMVLREGKYHQIKRMFGVLDLGVIWLKRTKIGELCLDENLAEGGCRKILHKEKEKILCTYTSPVE